MSTMEINLPGPRVAIAERTLRCFRCAELIKPRSTYILAMAYGRGRPIEVPVCLACTGELPKNSEAPGPAEAVSGA